MSRAVHFVTNNAPGNGLTDRRCLPCSGVSGRAVSLTPCPSRGDYKTLSQINIVSLKCTSRGMSSVCKAGNGGYRRNPDFSRQNKHGFSRSRKMQNEERDGSESLEESELFSKNGPLLSVSSPPKFQATATPGPREKEIVELFRKVQAQLRERAAVKEERKTEELRQQGKESGTVDSLLKLLRKHTNQPEKSSSSSSSTSRDFILNQPVANGAFEEDESMSSLDSNNTMKDEARECESPSSGRPVSNFQRRSPVPQAKFQTIRSDYVTDTLLNGKGERTYSEPQIHEPKLEIEPEANFSDGDVFDGMLEVEPSDIDEGYTDDDAEEQKPIVDKDLSAMKLPELRLLAKSRGLKGFSKLKKLQLVELLSGGLF